MSTRAVVAQGNGRRNAHASGFVLFFFAAWRHRFVNTPIAIKSI